jgi:hypothetical protein
MGIIVTSYGLMGVTARNKQEKRQWMNINMKRRKTILL